MSKLRKPTPQKSPATPATALPPAAPASVFPAFLRNVRLQALLIFGFATLIYLNTLTHGFVLDDGIVITDNMFTQQGAKGIPGILSKDTFFGFFKVEGKETLVSGGRYRPLTLVLFALIYQVAGASPFVFHLFTVLLFAATCAVFYLTVRKIFARMGEDYADLLAWAAALIFAAHPIHTEVVANIKGCDEILTLLGCLGATYFALRALHESKAIWAVLSGTLFFLACLSKENAAAFVFVIPVALWCSLPVRSNNDSRPTQGWGDVVKAAWPVWAAFVAFFVLRGTILHWRFGGEPMELMNNPFLKIENGAWVKFSFGEKMATIFYTLWKYVALLFAPLTLSHDYYPRQVPTMSFSHPAVLGSMALYGFLAYYAVVGIWKHRDPLRFGILLYLLSLSIVSNVVFPIGTNMGERFAFMPSAGFCIAVAALLMRLTQGRHSTVLAVVGVVAALFAVRTVMRNPVWASNDRLFLSDAAHSPNSAKLQNACAGTYFDRASKETDAGKKQENYQLAVKHAKLAVNIHPTYKDALLTLAAAHYHLGEYDPSVATYRVLGKAYPDDDKARTYLAVALRDGGKYYGEKKGDVATAVRYLNESWSLNPSDWETARLLGVANGVQGKHAEAIQFFGKAVEIDPKNASLLFDLGTAYLASGNVAKGQQLQSEALQINPNLMADRKKAGQ